MLDDEQNELLVRTGPGTPMGELMREYWIPAMLCSELAHPDCDPVRVKLLGEQLIGFRDTSGRVGLIVNLCPHRGASLFYGRNEQDGIRCVYHGWKFAIDGSCTDMPNEPPESKFKDRICATTYPCVERGGLIWTYMGRRSTPPPLPDIEANLLGPDDVHNYAVYRECNWLQAIEGDLDTSHLGFLHMGAQRPEDFDPGSFNYYIVRDRAPKYVALDTDYGAMYGAYRPAGAGEYYWRVAQFLFPFYSHIPTGVLGEQILTRAWVPMDDHHIMFFSMGQRTSQVPGVGPEELIPNGTGWYERFRPIQAEENDYLIDREAQRRDSFTGIAGIHMQDRAITESMGPILDRSAEHLGTSDVMVIRLRRRLADAANALLNEGATPPGVGSPEVYRVRSGGVVLPEGADWLEATRELVEH